MFDYIKGTLVTKNPTRVVVDAGGIGYEMTVPLSTSAALHEGAETTILTHLHVGMTQNQLKLFGFATEIERLLFRRLIAITGIGPSAALSILSATPVEEFVRAVLDGNLAALKRVKGIGDKTAGRLILEMKQSADALLALVPGAAPAGTPSLEETRMALTSLGFTQAVADRAARRALEDFDAEPATEDLVKAALKYT